MKPLSDSFQPSVFSNDPNKLLSMDCGYPTSLKISQLDFLKIQTTKGGSFLFENQMIVYQNYFIYSGDDEFPVGNDVTVIPLKNF